MGERDILTRQIYALLDSTNPDLKVTVDALTLVLAGALFQLYGEDAEVPEETHHMLDTAYAFHRAMLAGISTTTTIN